MRSRVPLAILAASLATAASAAALELPKDLGKESRGCVECHLKETPGLVHAWARSRHAWVRPESALEKPLLSRRLSTDRPPEQAARVVVGCLECHGRNPGAHPDTFEHGGQAIHAVVTPKDCEGCHPAEVTQYAKGKMASSAENLSENETFRLLARALEPDVLRSSAGDLSTCAGCHGGRVSVAGRRGSRPPLLDGWPNRGAGRLNPDGTRGICTACHSGHAFAIEEARRPEACARCHSARHSPAWTTYRDSAHAAVAAARTLDADWRPVPWAVGRDFTSPTCAACHASLLADERGNVVVERTHDFGARLWVRLFGAPTSHPQSASGSTRGFRNAEGLSLPVDLRGRAGREGLIGKDEQAKRRRQMEKLCASCHAPEWIRGHFERMDAAVSSADRAVLAGSEQLLGLWQAGKATAADPFDEQPERHWTNLWFFEANAIRFTAAMAGGPERAAAGWRDVGESLRGMGVAAPPPPPAPRKGRRKR